eukprot:5258792-Alexandrium_andersonii.AAC.1
MHASVGTPSVLLGSRTPIAKDCAHCGQAGCRFECNFMQVLQNAPLGSFGDQFRGCSWVRVVQVSNA